VSCLLIEGGQMARRTTATATGMNMTPVYQLTLIHAGARGAESGGKGCQIRRPFHPDYGFLSLSKGGELALRKPL
jgi:hypothetical protein